MEDNSSQQEYTWSVSLLSFCKPEITLSLISSPGFYGATTQSQNGQTSVDAHHSSGSGYVHRRSESMAISATEQGECKICGFYIGPPLPLQSLFAAHLFFFIYALLFVSSYALHTWLQPKIFEQYIRCGDTTLVCESCNEAWTTVLSR